MRRQQLPWIVLASLALAINPAAGGEPQSDAIAADEPATSSSDWTFAFTTYGWLTWISGDVGVKGRSLNLDVSPGQVIDALDWSGIPAWFSYAEARKGPISFFNDIVHAKLTGSEGFTKSGASGALTLSANVEADFEQTVVELGGTYELWTNRQAGGAGTSLDALVGGRYWHQDVSVSADLTGGLDTGGLVIEGNRVFARSGSVDWVDPFIGARLRHQIDAGNALTLRGDIGGFGAGSDFSWQAIASYDTQICVTDSYRINGYLGYRALSVDYSEGSGRSRFEFDAVLHGPVLGAMVNF